MKRYCLGPGLSAADSSLRRDSGACIQAVSVCRDSRLACRKGPVKLGPFIYGREGVRLRWTHMDGGMGGSPYLAMYMCRTMSKPVAIPAWQFMNQNLAHIKTI